MIVWKSLLFLNLLRYLICLEEETIPAQALDQGTIIILVMQAVSDCRCWMYMRKYIEPIVIELTELYSRGNNTCTSSGKGEYNSCTHVGAGT